MNNRWKTHLAKIRSISESSADWDSFPEFVTACQDLLREMEERRSGNKRLQALIDTLRGDFARLLERFEFQDVSGWSAQVVVAHGARLIEDLESFCSMLAERQIRESQFPGPDAPIREVDCLCLELIDLDSRIRSCHALISKQFSATTAEPAEANPLVPPSESEPEPVPDPPVDPNPPPPHASPPHPEPEAISDAVVDPDSGPATPPDRDPEPIAQPPVNSVPAVDLLSPEGTTDPDPKADPPVPSIPEPLPSPRPVGPVPDPRPSEFDEPAITLYKTSPYSGSERLWELARATSADVPGFQKLALGLLAAGDIPGAYWVARSLEATGSAAEFPSSFLALLQGCLWLHEVDDDVLVIDLLDQPITPDKVRIPMARLAVGLCGATLAPGSGLDQWLPETLPPALDELAQAAREFASHKKYLNPQWSDEGLPPAETQKPSTRAEVLQRARKWKIEEPQKKRGNALHYARRVWVELVKGPLLELIDLVQEDNEKNLEEVFGRANYWADRERAVEEIQKKYKGGNALVGGPRESLVQGCLFAAAIALAWCRAVEHQSPDLIEDGHAASQRSLVSCLTPALQQITSHRGDLLTGFLASCVERAIRRIAAAAGKPLPDPVFAGCVEESRRVGEGGLAAFLERRLLWVPEVPRKFVDDMPLIDDTHSIARYLRLATGEGRTLHSVFDQWLTSVRNLRIAQRVLLNFDSTAPQLSQISRERFREHLEAYRKQLRDRLNGVVFEVERAFQDGLITSDDRSRYLDMIEGIDVEQAMDFGGIEANLESGIDTPLRNAREGMLENCRRQWSVLRDSMASASRIKSADREIITRQIEEDLRRGDTRVLDERFASLRGALEQTNDGGSIWERLGWQTATQKRDLTGFIAVTHHLDVHLGDTQNAFELMSRRLERGDDPLTDFGLKTPTEARPEVERAFADWAALGRSFALHKGLDIMTPYVVRLLRFLGFRSSVTNPVTLIVHGHDWTLLRADFEASSESARPAWPFGSLANGRQHILLLSNRPSPARLREIFNELRGQLAGVAVIAFYFGARTQAIRRNFGAIAREGAILAAILDDSLLAFLGSQLGIRLPAFLSCTLPYSSFIPFTPDVRGNVAEELFVGRNELIQELWGLEGTCLIYGGRQLGKSTVQKRLLSIYHSPADSRFVWVAEVANILAEDPAQGTDALWLAFKRWMAEIGAPTKDSLPDKISDHIAHYLNSDLSRRILVLLDESDLFLDEDAAENFRQLRRLRYLMERTGRRFKVVLAGNRSVKRFDMIPDNPLVQFGQAAVVGPLEPHDARKLIIDPLAVLGIQFDSDSTLTRVLSLSNYHAVCLHEIGKTLIRMVRRQADFDVPYTITSRHVETAFAEEKVRSTIAGIFLATLNLEPDYLIITYALIRDVEENRDSHVEPYSAADLLALASEAWPVGFVGMADYEFYLRLDELCGLGVLVRDHEGGYRLRSPNLIRLLAGYADAQAQFEQKRSAPRPPARDFENEHLRLDDRRFNPLSVAQMKALNIRQTGVSLLFSSPALGLPDLSDAIRLLIPKRVEATSGNVAGRTSFACIPPEYISSNGLREWISQHLNNRKSHDRVVLYAELPPAAPIEAWVKEALEACKRHYSANRLIRLHIALAGEAQNRWFKLPEASRAHLTGDLLVTCRKWSHSAIGGRLQALDFPATDAKIRELVVVTGGWPYLLDHILLNESPSGVQDAVKSLAQALSDPQSPILRDFLRSLNLGNAPEAVTVIRFLHANGSQPFEYVTEDLIDGLSNHEIGNAVQLLSSLQCLSSSETEAILDPVIARLPYTALDFLLAASSAVMKAS